MSFRKSSSSGEELPLSKCGERTPLKSLENEMFGLSTPSSRFKSKSLLTTNEVKTTKQGDPPLSPLSAKAIHITDVPSDTTSIHTAFGLGDVTFKSFICSGGEVEIEGSPVCEEEIIILLKNQAVENPSKTEDTVLLDSIIVQSCSGHMEHPYYKSEVNDASLAETDAACISDILNTPDSGDLSEKHAKKDLQETMTWNSSACEGIEVVVSDITSLQDETIPLPLEQVGEPLSDISVNQTNPPDCGQLSEAEHADHPYCSSENVASDSEKPADGVSNVTFKSFNCAGGEVEISESTTLTEETVPLPAGQTATCFESCNYDIDPSMLPGDQDAPTGVDHFDHLYGYIKNSLSTQGDDLSIAHEPVSLHAVDEVKKTSIVVYDSQPGREDSSTPGSFTNVGIEVEHFDRTQLSHMTLPLPDGQAVTCQPPPDVECVPTGVTQDQTQDNGEHFSSHVENKDIDPPTKSASSHYNKSLKALENESFNCQIQETPDEDRVLLSVLHKTNTPHSSHPADLADAPTPLEVHMEHASELPSSSGSHGFSEAKDSALGSSGNVPVLCDSADKPAETLPDVLRVLSDCPSVASALPFGALTPVVRRASLLLRACKDPELERFLADASVVDGEKSLVAPVNFDPAGLWAEHLESPMPRPLFNSTALCCKIQQGPLTEPVEDVEHKPFAVPQTEVEKPALETPLIPDGPLQQQLRQMAEFLLLASGKMGPAALSAPIFPPAASTVLSVQATPVQSHSVCVGTTPLKQMDHSVNTSGKFERKREFSVDDACTLTDPLLWNVPPGSLESLPKQELELRLRSSIIMVEALVQQLAAARTHPPAGPAPSNLREKLVQTDHSELSQTTMHRDLYLEALNRIGELELDESSLKHVIQCMQDMKVTMTTLSCDTDAALTSMKQIGDIVKKDHQSLVSHYGQVKSLFEKTKQTQAVVMQRVKEAFRQRDDMKTQMEEAFSAKEAAFSAVEGLRTHCATEISKLEEVVGSHQELLAALNKTYPEQVALNRTYTATLDSATDVLSATKEEHSSLMKELCTVRGLLHKATPLLLKLNERAAAALRERDECIFERDQAVEEREQIAEEWNQTKLNLQTAREEISDLNLQVTILTSEMGVLRQKLAERDEERGQLDRKVTELSATVSSTLASYAFLEQALAAETTKLQQSWKDIQLSKNRASELEVSLTESEQRVCELSQALAQSEEQLSQLQALSQSQSMQIQQLQDVCTQLSGVREENEFLQMESELAREQMAESERVLMANLQGLRERNFQCEDLKGEIVQLQSENRSLQEELENTKSNASTNQLGLEERLAQAVTEITVVHHTLRGLTNKLHVALNEKKPELMKDRESQQVHGVDSIMIALTAEKEEDDKQASPGPDTSDMPEPQRETLFSETSAFTRITAVTPKKGLNTVELESEENEQSSEAELLASLSSTVTELISNLKLIKERKDAELKELHSTVCVLQGEQQAANSRHEAELFELKRQLHRLNSLVEKGNQALQQKAQDEDTVMKLMSDVQEAQEILNKHKTENNELQKEVVELRRSLQYSKVESKFLREELKKVGGQSANPTNVMEEKIQILKEVERLKLKLQEVEQSRVKLLDRAKRHQIIHQTNQQKSENELQMLSNLVNRVRETLLSLPEVVKKSEQLQQLVEYIG
ncbi:sperm-associated antigen 5 [Xyrichtys novacula]|uniref:Sperm-associated antigen 5 n=1 Tax=Xyrichtys novacula TaxID=13765 RepID=A0AAV1EUB5_XYRNO|nr:sperm-associated antigen 5 [Xyrichtys novacula]